MSKNQRLQQEALSTVDAAKAMVDKVFSIMGLMQMYGSQGVTLSTNPIGFLMNMLNSLGVSREELTKWLTDFLIWVTPMLEVGVKAVILSNLKGMISCSSDPRIPYKFRKYHESLQTKGANQYGFDISIESIDFFDKLSVSPLSKEGKEMYFGLEGVDDVYKFARADDFDAFLWFVMHRAKFPTPTPVNTVDDIVGSVSPTHNEGGTLMSKLTVTYSSDSPSKILLGNTFTYRGVGWPAPIAMCIDRKYDENNNVIENTIVPVSDDKYSANWYMRRADQLGKNIGFGWKTNDNGDTVYGGKPRDFGKEIAICNLQYINNASSNGEAPVGWANDKFRFTILPKTEDPYYNTSNGVVTSITVPLFNESGKYDMNGNYTFINRPNTPPPSADEKNLKACYKGLTVYEFNYDYLMSIKLFDAKVLATAVMECLIDTQVGFNAKLSNRRKEAQDKVREIVKKMIEEEDPTVNDCFFKFDNTKYNELLKKSTARRAKALEFGDSSVSTNPFNSVAEILSEYDANADMYTQEEVISRAIRSASLSVSEGAAAEDKYHVELSFATDFVNNLVNGIVFAVLSPKVLMLLEVNKQLTGDFTDNISFEELLRSMTKVIVGIVKEVQSVVVAELAKFVMKKLEPIIITMGTAMVREAADDYVSVIRDIIKNCAHLPRYSNGILAEGVDLDNVDYADIIEDTRTRTETPKENC